MRGTGVFRQWSSVGGPRCVRGLGVAVLLAGLAGCGVDDGAVSGEPVASPPLFAQTSAALTRTPQRPERWAEPMALAGVPNLFRFEEGAYRSAQPTRDGLVALAAQAGLRTVVSLRAGFDDGPVVAGTGLELVEIPMETWETRDEDVVAFLKVAVNPSRRPLLVHCWRGADRTGLQVAAYRVVVQGWTKADAIDELERGGYGFSPLWQNIPSYLRGMDVPAIRRAVGLEP